MNRATAILGALAVVAPYTVVLEENPQAKSDSLQNSVTTLRIAFGGGQYAHVTRGCSGEVLTANERDFSEIGFDASHKFRGPLSLGLRGSRLGKVSGYEVGDFLWNPYASLDWEPVGFGLGYVFAPEESHYNGDFGTSPVSGHLRIGPLDRTYFSMSLFENVPAYSGAGAFDAGVGFHPTKAWRAWVGLSSPVPFDYPGLGVKSSVQILPYLSIDAAGRVGQSQGIVEVAGSAGLTLTLSHGK